MVAAFAALVRLDPIPVAVALALSATMINTLPTELQQHILVAAVRPDWPWPESSMELGDKLSMAPFRLCVICRLWRDIVLNTPMIWQIVHFSGLLQFWRFDRAELVMKRAKENTLQLVIDASAGAEAERPDLLKMFHSLFEIHGNRWSRIHIIFPAVVGRLFVSSFFHSQVVLPNLEELVVLPTTGRRGKVSRITGVDIRTQALQLPSMPMLRRWEIHALPVAPEQIMRLSSLQFLSYNLRGTTETLLWKTLESCPNLVSLNIYFAAGPDQWAQVTTQPIRPISLPKVTQLAIFGFWNDSDWLHYINLPMVQTLTVSVESCNYMQPLFTKLGVQIRHLTITTIDGSTFSMISDTDAAVLRDLERLETLELSDLPTTILLFGGQSFFRHLMDGTIRDVSAPAVRPVWVNSFTRLILRNCVLYLSSSRALANLVQSRREDADKGLGPELSFEIPGTRFSVDEQTNDPEMERIKTILSSTSDFHGQ